MFHRISSSSRDPLESDLNSDKVEKVPKGQERPNHSSASTQAGSEKHHSWQKTKRNQD